MSILIKGMNMPTGCQCCFIERVGNRCLCGRHITTEEWNAMHRPDWCPLVELPEKHGRLIDERVAYDKIAEQEGGYYMDMDGVDMGLQETPTVIEAEGNDNGV